MGGRCWKEAVVMVTVSDRAGQDKGGECGRGVLEEAMVVVTAVRAG
jgi:hypothetical protein